MKLLVIFASSAALLGGALGFVQPAKARCSFLDITCHKTEIREASRTIAPITIAQDSGAELPSFTPIRGVKLRNGWSGKCLQMGQDRNNGSLVSIWDCTNTGKQLWVLTSKGELRNLPSNKCLQTMGQDRENGSSVSTWDCTNTTNQLWERTSTGEFRNRWSSKCLQTMGQDRENGSPVTIWDCTNTTNQLWR